MNRKAHRRLAYSLFVTALMTGCDSSAPALKLEQATTQKLRMEMELERQKHEHSLAQEKERYERLKADQQANKQEDVEGAARLKRDLDDMRERLDSLEEEKKKLQQEFDQFKADHRVRVLKNPAGMALPDFLASDGQSYVRPIISSRTSAALTFRHSGGVSTLAWPALPADLQKKLLAGEVWSEPAQEEVIAITPGQDPPAKSSVADSSQARLNVEAQKRQDRDAKAGTLNQMRANRDLLREQLDTQRDLLRNALNVYAREKNAPNKSGGRITNKFSRTAGGTASTPYYSVDYSRPEITSWIDNRDLALRDCRAMRDRVVDTARKLAAADHAYKSAGGY